MKKRTYLCLLLPLLLALLLLWPRTQEKVPSGPVTVACVGDSITYGAMLNGTRDTESYPAVLSALLGEGYTVENYGVCGQELLGTAPLSQSQWYQASLAAQPGLVIFMLGTNDARPLSWQGRDAFRAALEETLTAYLSLQNPPKLWLCTPAQLFVSEDSPYEPDLLAEITAVIRETAADMGLPLIDIYALTQDHPEWYVYDGIHPNAQGYQAIAEEVFQAVTEQF